SIAGICLKYVYNIFISINEITPENLERKCIYRPIYNLHDGKNWRTWSAWSQRTSGVQRREGNMTSTTRHCSLITKIDVLIRVNQELESKEKRVTEESVVKSVCDIFDQCR